MMYYSSALEMLVKLEAIVSAAKVTENGECALEINIDGRIKRVPCSSPEELQTKFELLQKELTSRHYPRRGYGYRD